MERLILVLLIVLGVVLVVVMTSLEQFKLSRDSTEHSTEEFVIMDTSMVFKLLC